MGGLQPDVLYRFQVKQTGGRESARTTTTAAAAAAVAVAVAVAVGGCGRWLEGGSSVHCTTAATVVGSEEAVQLC